LSQRALASRAHINISSLNAIENGHQIPTLDTLERLAKSLGSDLAALLDFPESSGKKADHEKDEIITINRLLRKADLRTLERIKGIIELLLQR
jgi:transcriptional regulator with XRE-family HTH domain